MSNTSVQIQFIGSGDAFGSGGRGTTCFHIKGRHTSFLMDCGASALPFLKKYAVSLNEISVILITHFHGDHFGGLPFFLLDAHLMQGRREKLTIVGPEGIKVRTFEVMEALFRGSTTLEYGFDLEFVELIDGADTKVNDLLVTTWPVIHADGSNPHGMRVIVEKRIIAYSGDSEWTENLTQLSQESDLFICECFNYEGVLRHHMSYTTLLEKKEAFQTKRLIMTHMNEEVLKHENLQIEKAEEGKTIVL